MIIDSRANGELYSGLFRIFQLFRPELGKPQHGILFTSLRAFTSFPLIEMHRSALLFLLPAVLAASSPDGPACSDVPESTAPAATDLPTWTTSTKGAGIAPRAAVTTTLPKSSGATSTSAPITVKDFLDGEMKLYDRSRKLTRVW